MENRLHRTAFAAVLSLALTLLCFLAYGALIRGSGKIISYFGQEEIGKVFGSLRGGSISYPLVMIFPVFCIMYFTLRHGTRWYVRTLLIILLAVVMLLGILAVSVNGVYLFHVVKALSGDLSHGGAEML